MDSFRLNEWNLIELLAFLSSAGEEKKIRRITLSQPILILLPVTSEPVYLWNAPNRWFLSIQQLSQSFVAPVPTDFNIKFMIKMHLQKYLILS